MRERRRGARRPGLIACLLVLVHGTAGAGEPQAWAEAVSGLVRAYPDFLDRVDGNELVWRDGERTVIDDGAGPKPFELLLARPDIKDQFRIPYPQGRTGLPPARDSDPGRVRHQRLFEKMYGDCLKDEVKDRLVEVVWLPRNAGQKLRITRINGVAERLAAVSRELDDLDPKLLRFLKPSSGTYNCRPIAGTARTSAHGYGFAIDINAGSAEYWRWSRPAADGSFPYRNSVPWEIVEVFERHGFIWGGKWYHYDTMHFEYRPELLPPAR